MTVNITITYASIIAELRRQLALYGKRATDKQGNSAFSRVTISTKEEPALKTYISQGVDNAVADIQQFVENFTSTSTQIKFDVINTRWKTQNEEFKDTFTNVLNAYIVAYALFEYLAQAHPEAAQKLSADAQARINALHRLMFYKYPPSESNADYNSIQGTVG